MGLKPEITVQLGKETSWGTRVDPTVRLAGVEDVNIKATNEFEKVDALRGDLYPGHRTILKRTGGEGKIAGLVNYEEAPYIAEELFHIDSDNPDTDMAWSWSAPGESSDIPDPRICTLVRENGTQIHSLSGATLKTLTVTFEEGNAIKYDAEYFGADIATDILATASDFGDVTFVMADQVVLYIDPGSDTVGTTGVSDLAFSAELTINTNRDGKRHLGDLAPSNYREHVWDGQLKLKMELSAVSAAYVEALLAATADAPKYNVRLKASSGTYVYQWDFGGALMEPPEIFTYEDDVEVVELTLEGIYTSGMSNWLAHEIVNAGTALK